MNIKKILSMLSAAALIGCCAAACDKEEESSSAADEVEISENESSEPEKKASKGEEICFLSDYDLNPVEGQPRSIALTLYEDLYGGSIKWIPTTRANLYEDLAKALQGGVEVDMFPYTDNALPNGVSQGYFEPLDDYIDLSSDRWSDMSGLAEKMAYNGKHYAVPTSIGDTTVLIYSRKAVKDAELEDPAELYKNGKWTWDKFVELMDEFSGTGCTGWIGKGLMQSSGQPYVTYDGSKFSSNLGNETLAEAGAVQDRISGWYNSDWHDTYDEDYLFLGMGEWAIPQSNDADDEADIFFVPFPTKDGSEKYITADINSKMLVKGSKKAAAVAGYLECERIADSEEKYLDAQKKAAVDGGFTEEQYDFLREIKSPDNVMFDFSYGMSRKMAYLSSDYKERGALDNLNDAILIGFGDAPDSWEKLRDSFKETVEKEAAGY